jgi:hypothetical protein
MLSAEHENVKPVQKWIKYPQYSGPACATSWAFESGAEAHALQTLARERTRQASGRAFGIQISTLCGTNLYPIGRQVGFCRPLPGWRVPIAFYRLYSPLFAFPGGFFARIYPEGAGLWNPPPHPACGTATGSVRFVRFVRFGFGLGSVYEIRIFGRKGEKNRFNRFGTVYGGAGRKPIWTVGVRLLTSAATVRSGWAGPVGFIRFNSVFYGGRGRRAGVTRKCDMRQKVCQCVARGTLLGSENQGWLNCKHLLISYMGKLCANGTADAWKDGYRKLKFKDFYG